MGNGKRHIKMKAPKASANVPSSNWNKRSRNKQIERSPNKKKKPIAIPRIILSLRVNRWSRYDRRTTNYYTPTLLTT